MFGVDEILSSGQQSSLDKDQYYRILGCGENATAEQITTEYRIRAKQCHPDKNLNDPNAVDKFKLIQEAYETLLDEEKRKSYDSWRHSDVCIPYKKWLSMNERCKMTMHWAKPRTQTMIESQNAGGTKINDHGANFKPKEPFVKVERGKKSEWRSENESTVFKRFRDYQL